MTGLIKTFPVVFLLSIFALTGCVTTEQKAFDQNVSQEKELSTRVKIAIGLLKKGEAELALVQLKKALNIKPDAPRVYEIMAVAFEQVDENKEAKRHYKKMLSYGPEYTRGRANYAGFLIRRQEYKEAYRQLEKVVADIYYPSRARAFQQLGFCAKKLGKHDEIAHFYKRALKLDGNLTEILLALAEIRFEKGDYAESQAYLDAYREKVKPASAKALFLGIKLAVVFEDKGDEASYALALKNLYPRSKEYLEYIKTIKMK